MSVIKKKITSEKGFVLLFFAVLLPIIIFITKFVIEHFTYKTVLDEVKTSAIKSLNDSVHFFNESETDLLSHLKAKLIFDLNPTNIEDLNKNILIKTQANKESSASNKLVIQKCEIQKYVDEKAYDISENSLNIPYDENRYTFQLIKNRILSDIIEDFKNLNITTYNLNYDDMLSNVVINNFSYNSNYNLNIFKKWTYKTYIEGLIENNIFENIFWKKMKVEEYNIPSISFFVKVSFDDRVKLKNAGYNIINAVTEDAVALDTEQNQNFYYYRSSRTPLKKKSYEINLDHIKLTITKFTDYNTLKLIIPVSIYSPLSASSKEFNCVTQIKFYDNSIKMEDNYTQTFNVGIAVPVKTDTSNLNLYHIIMNNVACLVDKFDPKNTSVSVVPYYSKIKLPKDIFNDEALVKNSTTDLFSTTSTEESTDFFISSDSDISEKLNGYDKIIVNSIPDENNKDAFKKIVGYNIPKTKLQDIIRELNPKTLTFSIAGEMDRTELRGSTITTSDQNGSIDLFLSSPYDTYDIQDFKLNLLKEAKKSTSTSSIQNLPLSDLYDYINKEHNIAVIADNDNPEYFEYNIMETSYDDNKNFYTDDRGYIKKQETDSPDDGSNITTLKRLNLINPEPYSETICQKNPYNPFAILKLSSPSIAAMYLRLLNSIQTDEQSNFINIGALWACRMISHDKWIQKFTKADTYATKIIILIINKDINFAPNEKTIYGIINDSDNLCMKKSYDAQNITHVQSDTENSIGMSIAKLKFLTIATLTQIMREGTKLYVIEIPPMEYANGFPNLQDDIKNAVANCYGPNTVHFQRCPIENNNDNAKIDSLIRNLFKNIENDLHLKDTLKSVNYHSFNMIIDY